VFFFYQILSLYINYSTFEKRQHNFMEYQILPIGAIWNDGTFCVPKKIVSSYIKMASEYQLKALMLILASNGKSTTKDIAKALGCTGQDADEFLDFWVEEGILSKNGEVVNATLDQPNPEPIEPNPDVAKEEKPAPPVQSVAVLPPPRLSPKDVVDVCRNNKELTELLRNAQEVLGRTLSLAEQEMIINMVNYYGLPAEIVLTILHYYKTEKASGRAIGTSYIATMAKNWAEEGITTLEAADEKLKFLEESDSLWRNIVTASGIRHRNPTMKQREMIKYWSDNFSLEMITLACDIMKENVDRPTLTYVNTIIKNWIKKGIKTPADVQAENDKYQKCKDGQIQSKPTYDIDEITRKAMFNDTIDI
jgi:DnaD/phage-associated family protein